MTAPAVGIDLGTTNSVVAVSMGGRPQVLTDASGQPLIPSVVSFLEDGTRLVGRSARVRRALDPVNTIYSVKRLLGRAFKSEEVRRARSRMAFELREGPESAVVVKSRGGDLTLPEISAIVLREVRRVAEEALQEKIEKCVVTVPANFNELQRSSTKAAGRIAELDVVRILNEPTAAALAYGYGRGTREKICIFDFGGGTFDVTLLELAGNVFEVLATAGDTFLGGDDIDIALTDSLLTQFQRATKADALQDRTLYDVLRDAVEQAKCELSTNETSLVDFSFAVPGRGQLKFQHTLTRTEMEKVSAPFVTRTFDVCSEALKLANMRATDLTAVILVGGSTRIPSVRHRVASFFGRDPLTNLPPEEVVALGASILAEALTGGARRVNTRPIVPGAQPNQSVRPPAGPPAAATVGSDASGPGRITLSGSNVPSPNAVRTAQGVAPQTPARPQPYAAPNAPAIPQGPNSTFDLDDPFADKPTVTVPVPAGLVSGKAKDSDMMWRPMPAAPDAPISTLDEPSFMGRLPRSEGSNPGARVVGAEGSNPGVRIGRAEGSNPGARIEAGEERTVQVPAFNLEDPSFMGPMPTRPTIKRGDSTPGMSAVDDPFATVFTGPSPGSHSGAFQAVGAGNPSPSGSYQAVSGGAGTNDVSIPAFNLSADELFGEPSGPVSKPSSGSIPGVKSPAPFAPDVGASTVRQGPPPTPGTGTVRQGPPEIPSGNMTQKMSAVAPPPVPPPRPASNLQVPPGLPPAPPRQTPGVARQAMPPTTNSQSGPLPLPPPMPGAQQHPQPQRPGPSHSLAPQPSALGAPLLLDVTPFSLGVETAGGLCEAVIRRNATIPVEQTRVFATTNDGQESVILRIAQGESRKFQDNQPLGELELTGLREAARGEVAIAVTFELEADGTLKVRARDVESGREQAIRVTLLTVPSEAQQHEMAARNRPTAT